MTTSRRLLLTILLTLSACSGKNTRPPSGPTNSDTVTSSAPDTPRPGVLHRETAATRAKQIQKISYALDFKLNADTDFFEARAKLKFVFKDKGVKKNPDLLVDFSGAKIKELELNGKPVVLNDKRYDGEHIRFHSAELVQGSNELEVSYEMPYGKTGHGFLKYVDQVDKLPYLYTNLEPYHAHEVFPCFDQPDLKGAIELKVNAPASWTVIATMRESDVDKKDERKLWKFPATPALSTYVFALAAGPYAVWKNGGDVPLRLFARKSIADDVDSSDWFDITRRGLEFFSTQFGSNYPLAKYDQIIVPELTSSGMENAGAALFNESFVFRGKPTENEKIERAQTILHELAHAWFGNLVTMRWWNGLWLKESFSTYMAAWALEQSTPTKGAWQAFFARSEWPAYEEDQLSTTHPVDVSVPDTDSAYANFDSITYGKGAALIQLLVRTIGEDNFKEGLQRYFDKYAGRNATLSDLMKTLGEAAGEDLTDWQKYWFQTSGMNTVETALTCMPEDDDDDETTPPPADAPLVIKKLVIKQSGGTGGKTLLRPHREQLALFSLNTRSPKLPMKLADTLDVEFSGAETEVAEAVGMACPDLVFPNYKDYDYVKLSFDEKSLAVLKQEISRIEDPLTRHMAWRSLWNLMVDGKMPAKELAETILREAPREKNSILLSDMLEMLVSQDPHQATALRYLPDSIRPEFAERVESALKTGYLSSGRGSDARRIWLDAYFGAVHSPAGETFLRTLVGVPAPGAKKKRRAVPSTLDQEQRWDAIEALARMGTEGADTIITDELERDGTDRGRRRSIAAEAAIPDEANKKRWFDRVVSVETDKYSSGQLRSAMTSLLSSDPKHAKQLSDAYFEHLPKLAHDADEEYAEIFAQWLFPSLCSAEIVERAGHFMEEHSHLPAAVLKTIKNNREEEERCVRARAAG